MTGARLAMQNGRPVVIPEWHDDDGPTLYVDRVHGSGAIRIAAFVDDGTGAGPWRHVAVYYWEPDDGDPRVAYVADVLGRGWTFSDD